MLVLHHFQKAMLLWMGLSNLCSADIYRGVTEPIIDIEISSSSEGSIDKCWVESGSVVKVGSPLLQLDARLEKLSLKMREIAFADNSALDISRKNMSILKETLKSNEKLLQEGSVSQEEVDSLRLRINNLEGDLRALEIKKQREEIELQAARSELGKRSLSSPIDGIVIDSRKQDGEWVRAGEPVFRIVNITQCILEVNIPVLETLGIDEKTTVEVSFQSSAGQQQRKGKVLFCSPVADQASGLVRIRVQFDNHDGALRPGSPADLVIVPHQP